MADISQEIQAFKSAVYGEDVRDAMVSAMNKINTVNEQSVQTVQDIVNNGIPELADVRTGAGGETYNSAGDAVRGQVKVLNDALSGARELSKKELYEIGAMNSSTGGNANSDYYIRTKSYINTYGIKKIIIAPENGYKVMMLCYGENGYERNNSTSFITEEQTITLADTVIRIRLTVGMTDGTVASVDFADHVHIYGLTQVNADIIRLFDADTSMTNTIQDVISGITIKESEWEQGSISQGNNDTYRRNYRARLKEITKYPFDTTIKTKDGAQFFAYYYNEDGTYIEGYTNLTEYTIPANSYFRIMIDGLVGQTSQTFTVEEILEKTEISNTNIKSLQSDIDALRIESNSLSSNTPIITFMCRDGRVSNNIPPNSKYAIKATVENQYDKIRFSVSKTTDGYYVAVHDITINNLAVNRDGSSISETIYTADCSLDDLNQYDWGLKYGTQYAGLTVPMLEDCLKYASMYNLSVALDFKWGSTFSDSDADAITAMLAKYGHYDAFILVSYNNNKTKFITRGKRFSESYICDYSSLIENTEFIDSLLTGRNKVYLWSTVSDQPTVEEINYAMAHDLDIACSEIGSMSDLISVGFEKGITLMECHYIKNIKTTVREYINSLI